MWKKEEGMPAEQPRAGATPAPETPRAATSTAERASIGRSITIQGEVSGDEDLLIQGTIDGSVSLELHAVTVGREGRVKANITGRIITVEGAVEGDLQAHEQIILRSSARVEGDIKAPRVVLDDGANFRGLVDMGPPPEPAKSAKAPSDRAMTGSNGSPDQKSATTPTATTASTGADASPSGKASGAKHKNTSASVGKAAP